MQHSKEYFVDVSTDNAKQRMCIYYDGKTFVPNCFIEVINIFNNAINDLHCGNVQGEKYCVSCTTLNGCFYTNNEIFCEERNKSIVLKYFNDNIGIDRKCEMCVSLNNYSPCGYVNSKYKNESLFSEIQTSLIPQFSKHTKNIQSSSASLNNTLKETIHNININNMKNNNSTETSLYTPKSINLSHTKEYILDSKVKSNTNINDYNTNTIEKNLQSEYLQSKLPTKYNLLNEKTKLAEQIPIFNTVKVPNVKNNKSLTSHLLVSKRIENNDYKTEIAEKFSHVSEKENKKSLTTQEINPLISHSSTTNYESIYNQNTINTLHTNTTNTKIISSTNSTNSIFKNYTPSTHSTSSHSTSSHSTNNIKNTISNTNTLTSLIKSNTGMNNNYTSINNFEKHQLTTTPLLPTIPNTIETNDINYSQTTNTISSISNNKLESQISTENILNTRENNSDSTINDSITFKNNEILSKNTLSSNKYNHYNSYLNSNNNVKQTNTISNNNSRNSNSMSTSSVIDLHNKIEANNNINNFIISSDIMKGEIIRKEDYSTGKKSYNYYVIMSCIATVLSLISLLAMLLVCCKRRKISKNNE